MNLLLRNKKDIINLAIIFILVIGLGAGYYLMKNQQVFRGRALGSPPVEFIGPANVLFAIPGGKIGLKVVDGQAASVELRLTSPFGAPGSGSTQPTSTQPTQSQPTPTAGTQPTSAQPTPTNTPQPTAQPTATRAPSPTSAPAPTAIPSNTCDISGISNGQTVSGSLPQITVTASKSSQYYLSLWAINTKIGTYQNYSTLNNDFGFGAHSSLWNNGSASFECRIQTTQSGGTTIFTKAVNFTVAN